MTVSTVIIGGHCVTKAYYGNELCLIIKTNLTTGETDEHVKGNISLKALKATLKFFASLKA